MVVPPVIWYHPDNDSFYINDNGYVDFMSADELSVAMNLLPGVGDVKGIIEAFKGKDEITGESLSWIDRLLGLILLAEIRGGKKGLELAIEIARGKKLSRIGSKGEGRRVRHVDDGDKADAEAFFNELRGDNPVEDIIRDGKKEGIRAKSDKWGDIIYRPETTDKGQPKGTIAPPTVYVKENGKQIKVKFLKK